jgi:4,5-DOPA dioxygenase extradiol
MGTAPGDVVHLRDHTGFGVVVPTPDQFIPLLYIAGLATAAGLPADVLVDGYAMGSLSMTAYSVGMQADMAPDQTDGGPPLPHLPADEATV